MRKAWMIGIHCFLFLFLMAQRAALAVDAGPFVLDDRSGNYAYTQEGLVILGAEPVMILGMNGREAPGSVFVSDTETFSLTLGEGVQITELVVSAPPATGSEGRLDIPGAASIAAVKWTGGKGELLKTGAGHLTMGGCTNPEVALSHDQGKLSLAGDWLGLLRFTDDPRNEYNPHDWRGEAYFTKLSQRPVMAFEAGIQIGAFEASFIGVQVLDLRKLSVQAPLFLGEGRIFANEHLLLPEGLENLFTIIRAAKGRCGIQNLAYAQMGEALLAVNDEGAVCRGFSFVTDLPAEVKQNAGRNLFLTAMAGGLTPQGPIHPKLSWEKSLDNGATWQRLLSDPVRGLFIGAYGISLQEIPQSENGAQYRCVAQNGDEVIYSGVTTLRIK